jgi:hypothetical protein
VQDHTVIGQRILHPFGEEAQGRHVRSCRHLWWQHELQGLDFCKEDAHRSRVMRLDPSGGRGMSGFGSNVRN